MTARELRQMLFNVSDQELTVSELRAKLFELEQDEELAPLELGQLTAKASTAIDYEYDPEWDGE